MKLRIPDWKSAWFESHISERFFQELARAEKAHGPALDTSAQWMEQLMVDTGQLAHAMLRLEEEAPTERHMRPAADKALRLSAMALHLATALGALTEGGEPGARAGTGPHGLTAAFTPPRAEPESDPDEPAAAAPEAVPGRPQPWTRPPLPPRMHAPIRSPQPPGREGAAAAVAKATEPAAADQAEPEEEFTPPLLGGLMQVHGRESANDAETRATIRSLSARGLSRREIATVTGQPRDVVDAALSKD